MSEHLHSPFYTIIRFLVFFVAILSVSGSSLAQEITKNDVENKVNLLIDKIIDETSFDFKLKTQKPSDNIQIIDFTSDYAPQDATNVYALSYVLCSEAKDVAFGFSSGSKTEVWINNKKIFSSNGIQKPWFKEFAYDMYQFPQTFQAHCDKGYNQVLIKMENRANSKFYLAAIKKNGLLDENVRFSLKPSVGKTDKKWMLCGAFNQNKNYDYLPENKILPVYQIDNEFINWVLPKIRLVLKIDLPENASFKKHPYNEWHYSTGATMWSVLNYAGQTKNKKYEAFVKQYCDFTLEKLDYFHHQYYDLNEIHGFNSRLFRMQMLDDASAPALPFLKLYSKNLLPKAKEILEKVDDYILNGQYRLPDNTFARPEPWAQTLWADDLFMSVPYLLMMGELTADKKYYDEAAFQVISFYKYLFDDTKGLCKHGWLDAPENDSLIFWSRANGWMIWAISETLLKLPQTHKDYKSIKVLYQKHIDGLISYQDKNGFLHQIIDDDNTFEETSSTAMLTLTIARGVNNAWLPKKYKKQAIKGWTALDSKIEKDGTVKGICQGTSLSTSRTYYKKRKVRDHDPRGLGAVITAGMEVAKLLELE